MNFLPIFLLFVSFALKKNKNYVYYGVGEINACESFKLWFEWFKWFFG